MAVPALRTFSVLVLFSLSMTLFFLQWGNISKQAFSWPDLSSKLSRGDENLESVSTRWKKEDDVSSILTSLAKATPATKRETHRAVNSTRGPEPETPMPVLYRKSFKKLPVWEFEDVYIQDAPPRPTTCAESLRNLKDASFNKAFLPNIRLFMQNDDLNVSEWNRLSHFNNPFGFMEFKYDEVLAAVKLIPKPKEPLLLPTPGGDGCVHCAVVGTGGILNGSMMGAEIDGHDYVFRMNGAVTKGYEEDVGGRTSVYVHTAHSITASPYFFKKYGYTVAPHDQGIKYVMIPEGMRDFQWLEGLLSGKVVSAGPYRNSAPRTYYSGQFNESRFYVLHQDFLRYVRNRFLKSSHLSLSHWAIVRPSNGAFALFLALHACDTVDAYGFMTDDYAKYSNYYVQRAIKTKVVFYANHDYRLEVDVWKDLHNRKVLRLYQREEETNSTTK